MVKENKIYRQKLKETQAAVFDATSVHFKRGNWANITSLKEVLDDLSMAVQFCISVLDEELPPSDDGKTSCILEKQLFFFYCFTFSVYFNYS